MMSWSLAKEMSSGWKWELWPSKMSSTGRLETAYLRKWLTSYPQNSSESIQPFELNPYIVRGTSPTVHSTFKFFASKQMGELAWPTALTQAITIINLCFVSRCTTSNFFTTFYRNYFWWAVVQWQPSFINIVDTSGIINQAVLDQNIMQWGEILLHHFSIEALHSDIGSGITLSKSEQRLTFHESSKPTICHLEAFSCRRQHAQRLFWFVSWFYHIQPWIPQQGKQPARSSELLR